MTTIVSTCIELAIIECAECGICFGVSPAFIENRAIDGDEVFCPGGHPNHWPDAKKKNPPREDLIAEIANLKSRVAELVHDAEVREAEAAASTSTRSTPTRRCPKASP